MILNMQPEIKYYFEEIQVEYSSYNIYKYYILEVSPLVSWRNLIAVDTLHRMDHGKKIYRKYTSTKKYFRTKNMITINFFSF